MAALAYTAVSAFSALNTASVKKKAKIREAKGLREQAARHSAEMTAEMQDLIDEKNRMQSRALAVAAASGAGVDDPTVVNLMGDLNAEGEYRVLSRLWVGDTEAQGYSFAADEALREGEAAENAGYLNAVTSGLSAWNAGSPVKATKKSIYKKPPSKTTIPSASATGIT